jgi:hypothetical protein
MAREMARPVRTTAATAWRRRYHLGRWARPVQGDTNLVGKGRRPAAAMDRKLRARALPPGGE